MEIAGSPDYIGDNLISVILCKYHIKEFSDRMLELYSKNPVAVSWNMANYGYMLNDRRMIPILDEIAKSNGGEISCAAKKTLRKLLVWCDKNSV